jgi:radical SAM-linked protein
VVQRLRIQYAKRGRLRFASQRDFARAFERALRRADVPMAYSAGFTPHPKISYVGAAPTGAASEAEYLEIGLSRRVPVAALCAALDEALPDGLDIVAAVEAGSGSLAGRIEGSTWRLELFGIDSDGLRAAVTALLAAPAAPVERLTKEGRRTLDVRAAVVRAEVAATASAGVDPEGPHVSAAADLPNSASRAILDVVVRQAASGAPTVRPDDVLAALRTVGGLALDPAPGNYRALRLAQGPLDATGHVGDPLADDHATQPSP